MANTVSTTKIIENQREAVIYFTLVSDGSNETNTVIYDSSAIASDIGITDPLNCNLLEVKTTASMVSTAKARLDFYATTPVLALVIMNGNDVDLNFAHAGGLRNYAGTGKNGDITLTTTGLASGDLIAGTIRVRTS